MDAGQNGEVQSVYRLVDIAPEWLMRQELRRLSHWCHRLTQPTEKANRELTAGLSLTTYVKAGPTLTSLHLSS